MPPSSFPPNYNAGPATDVQVNRNGHSFNLNDEYQDISRGFATHTGFLQTSNIRSDHLHSNYQWFPKHSTIQSIGLETNQNIAFDHANNRVYHYSTFDPFFLLPNNIVLAPLVGQNSDTVGPQDGYPLPASHNFTENYGGFVAKGQPSSQLNFNIQALRSGNVNYNPLPGQSPFLLNQETVQALISINPIRHLTDDSTYLLDRDHAAHGGQFVYETQTFRTKLNYQFTRAWSARFIVEYDSTLANPLQTSLQRTKEVQDPGTPHLAPPPRHRRLHRLQQRHPELQPPLLLHHAELPQLRPHPGPSSPAAPTTSTTAASSSSKRAISSASRPPSPPLVFSSRRDLHLPSAAPTLNPLHCAPPFSPQKASRLPARSGVNFSANEKATPCFFRYPLRLRPLPRADNPPPRPPSPSPPATSRCLHRALTFPSLSPP